MKRSHVLLAALLFVGGTVFSDAAKAQIDPTGRWSCFAGAQDLKGQGGSLLYRFEMRVHRDGRATGGGSLRTGLGEKKFQFAGSWILDGGDFGMQAPNFVFASTFVGRRGMSASYPMATGSTMKSGCRRLG